MAKESKKYEASQEMPQKQKGKSEEERNETLVRILGYDIPGSKKIYPGLTRIKGISWAISNSICRKINLPEDKKVENLSKEEVAKIESAIKSLLIPDYLKNRRKDPETGQSNHLYGSDLDIRKEFDIKRLREIKSYKGLRHALKLPVRGQRTRSHFRKKGVAMGVKRKK